ncbi:MAG: NAD(+) synthase [Spirochaetales bacterium]|nr:NAD(+) synthase [Leptospiraceae bacterium]MCP5480813.1 NAD(+) synthase [Spirochaetales bacterium]
MSQFRLATIALNQTPLDWAGNEARIRAALKALAGEDHRPQLTLFPELCLTGYGCEDAFHSPDVARRAGAMLTRLAQFSHNILPDTAILLGLPVRHLDRVYNCMAVVQGGVVRGLVPKRNLAGDGVHYEPRWFSAYRGSSEKIDFGEESVLFGSLLFRHSGVRFAIEICEDAWVPVRPALDYMRRGAELILNPSASHFAFGKYERRKAIALESSRAYACIFVQVNLLGNEAGRMIYDGSSLVCSAGDVLREDRGFSFGDSIARSIDLDLEPNRALRSRLFSLQNQEPASGAAPSSPPPAVVELPPSAGRKIGFGSSGTEAANQAGSLAQRKARTAALSRFQEFVLAQSLGLLDYMRKSRSRGFVVSLSGGADSATCALLVALALRHAAEELGVQVLLDRLGRGDLKQLAVGNDTASSVRAIVPEVLFTLYQATAQSSSTTREASAALADAIGSKHSEVEVEGIVDAYLKAIEPVLKRSLDWEQDDIALQNIQARVRSPMVWLLANVKRCLLLTTSNRSEAAVGYCTMDGDSSGGLAPLGGVDKAFIQTWLGHMENVGDEFMGPLKALELINAQAPTAELRPASFAQTDEKDLMPYPVLDLVERLAIRDRKAPEEVLRALEHAGLEIPRERLLQYVRRFFTLWSQNQWKRERYAPSFHMDEENLDPRSWYRFPILSGGYDRELEELD